MKVTGVPHKMLMKNSFKVLDVEDEDDGGDDPGEIFIGSVEVTDDTEVVKNWKSLVKFIRSITGAKKEFVDDWVGLGTGDIVIDSAADESCWPVG